MGDYRIEITATGSHGCCREQRGRVYGCRRQDCPDCEARDLVERLRFRGAQIKSATFTHWPGTEGQVVDDLVTQQRAGEFPEAQQAQAEAKRLADEAVERNEALKAREQALIDRERAVVEREQALAMREAGGP